MLDKPLNVKILPRLFFCVDDKVLNEQKNVSGFINVLSQKITKNEQVTIQSLIIQIYPPTLFSLFQRKFIVFIR